MDHRGSTKPSAAREVDLSLNLTVNLVQFRVSVQVKKQLVTFSLVTIGLSIIGHAILMPKIIKWNKNRLKK